MVSASAKAALQANHQTQILPHPRVSSGVRKGAAKYFLRLRQIPGKHIGKTRLDSTTALGTIFNALA